MVISPHMQAHCQAIAQKIEQIEKHLKTGNLTAQQRHAIVLRQQGYEELLRSSMDIFKMIRAAEAKIKFEKLMAANELLKKVPTPQEFKALTQNNLLKFLP